jgi:hypothetical protein
MTRPRPLLALLVSTALAVPAGAQQAPAPPRCLLQLLNADREGVSIEVAPGVTNYHVGGNVRFRCQRQPVFMWADSVASYGGSVVQFIGNVRYRDTTVEMTARFGTYLRGPEKWEARENVVYRNLQDGTTLRGPALDYFREMPGLRTEAEMFADRRPTVTIPVRDTLTGQEEEPYVVVADRIRTRGADRVFGGGRVTIDRSDFRGRADSLFLDQGPAGEGALIGGAVLEREGDEAFRLTGRRIDLALASRRLTYVTARDSARLESADLVLDGDGIGLDIGGEEVEQTLAWGREVKPVAVAAEFEVRGDSLAFDTPDGVLRELRAFGEAWVGGALDSLAGERDWIAGDTVVAEFVQRDSAGVTRTTPRRVEATGRARAYYRFQQAGDALASINYSRADRIEVRMRVTADSVAVEYVTQAGRVEGMHLQPRPPAPPDTAAAANRPPPRPRREDRR